jgi:hypothetical protein
MGYKSRMPMFERLRISELSIPLGIFVLTLLLFPAAHGSFVATHGPVTALRSLQIATMVLLALSALYVLLTLHFAALRRALATIEIERRRKSSSARRDRTCSLLC